ncbi:TPA: hypothetical protein ACX6R8_003134 [Photobacterium damselae]
MNRYHQQGMSTLLITSMLLVVALIFSLASYKNLFYQIKRTQNEVLARQAHWTAEGGLECGFAEISNKSDVNTSLDKCKTVIDGQPLTLSISTNDGRSLLTSETNNKYKKITKTIVSGGARSSGVIKSTADLYFSGHYQILPDPNVKIDSDWACSLIRYKNILYIHNQWSSIGNYNSSNDNFKCDDNYKTLSATNRNMFEKDIIKEDELDIFYETFGESRDNWELVKKQFFVENTDPDKSCIKKITSSISEKNRHVWITGDCRLSNEDLILLPQESNSADKGIFILVQNGILEITGTSLYKAIIYHFNNDYEPDGDQWKNTALDISGQLSDMFNSSIAEDKIDPINASKQTVSYLYGSHRPSGGFIFDTPNKIAYLGISGQINFDGELITDLLAPFGKPRWQQGSWHDF